MNQALKLAQRAAEHGEVPVGAVIVQDAPQGPRRVAGAFNQKETLHTPLGHAEILAIHRASRRLGRWRLTDCTLYVTLEPCVMCAGAIVQARIGRVVFGALDPKGGAVESLFRVLSDQRLNHRCEFHGGLGAEAAGKMLREFFRNRR